MPVRRSQSPTNGFVIKPTLTQLQRELADKITGHAPLDDIRICLASGAQVNEPVVQGLRPLHYAVYGNNLDCVRLLLVRGSDINAMDEVGYAPLHLCAEHGNYGLIEYLINHNAKVSFVDPDDKDPFPRKFKSDEPLRLAVKNGHYDCAVLLLEHGADPNAKYFFGSELNLLAPAETEFLKLLLMYGGDPNSFDRSGLTPLMKAARHRDGFEALKILIEYGANVNAYASERQDFRTPLHYAILSGNMKSVNYLIEHGAKINMASDYGKPSPLDFAVLRDSPEIVSFLLSNEANPNAVYTYIGTPLHLACCSDLTNQQEIIEMLLKAGADPNLCPRFDDGVLKSPFVEYFRSRAGPFDIGTVKLMLDYGAEVVMQSPLSNPRGMLRNLMKVHDDPPLFSLLLDAGQDFSLQSVERLAIPVRRRLQVQHFASAAAPLTHLCRLTVRHALQPLNRDKVQQLPLPHFVKAYLLYDV